MSHVWLQTDFTRLHHIFLDMRIFSLLAQHSSLSCNAIHIFCAKSTLQHYVRMNWNIYSCVNYSVIKWVILEPVNAPLNKDGVHKEFTVGFTEWIESLLPTFLHHEILYCKVKSLKELKWQSWVQIRAN